MPDLDINGERGSFLSLYDRYCIVYRWIMIFSVLGVVAELWHGNKPIALEFATAAVLSILFQLVLMFFYEEYLGTKYAAAVTNGNYTESRRAVVLILGLLSEILFAFATVAMIVLW